MLVDPRDESHRDPERIDFSVPRLARYMHIAWKRHHDAVFWVDIDLGIKEGLVFYQTRSNAIILQGTLPAYCIPKVERLKTGEVFYERPYLSLRPPLQISLNTITIGQKGMINRILQLNISQLESSLNSLLEKYHVLTVEEFVLAEHRDSASSNANKFNLATEEENIDFNIPGVPNSMVKRSHGINVHNLIQQIENHPQREALQSDLQQHRAFNSFSEESKDAIKAAGNIELCEIVDVELKSQ